MHVRPPLQELVGCAPLDAAQARVLVAACPGPAMVADVVGDAFSVLAVAPLLRRFVTGAVHPAGPRPGELIGPEGFGMLGSELASVVAHPMAQTTAEMPIGDEPSWYELVITPIRVQDRCAQIVVIGSDRTADHDIEARQRRNARRFQAMVTHAPGLIMLVDSTARIIRASPAVESYLGTDAADLVGRQVFELLHPESLPRAASAFGRILTEPGEAVGIPDFGLCHVDGGVVWCEATATNLLHDDDVAAIVFNAFDVTDRRAAEHELELLASSDALTGLPNRRQLSQRLATAFDEAARTGESVGLVIVGLDDFELVNDGLGHDVGDAVLRAVASRLVGLVDETGVVARLGGDEFALAVGGVDRRTLAALAEAVHDVLRSPVRAGEHEVYLRASIGTSLGDPTGSDVRLLQRSADLALYRAKRNGRNRTVAFSAELQRDAEDRLTRITELQRALREGRLRLAYQPVTDPSGSVVGAEALLRWSHDGTLLNPAAFLALAEDTGLILPIGAWVLDRACADLSSLRRAVPGLDWISVNVSSRQLLDDRLAPLVHRAMDDHGIEPGMLALELDEATVADPDLDPGALGALEEVRLFVAATDLTTDQRILHRLGDLPIAGFKLDRTLIGQIDLDVDGSVRALTAAVLELLAGNGIDAVAEGVETERQRDVLDELGCRLRQGFLFGGPTDLGTFVGRHRSPERRAVPPPRG